MRACVSAVSAESSALLSSNLSMNSLISRSRAYNFSYLGAQHCERARVLLHKRCLFCVLLIPLPSRGCLIHHTQHTQAVKIGEEGV
jgi:hypothetical protein